MIPTYKKKLTLPLKSCFISDEEFFYNSLYPYSDLSKQGEFQILLNKAVDLLSMKGDHHNSAFFAVQNYIRTNPNIIALNSLEFCEDWLTRDRFSLILSRVLNTFICGVHVRLPWQTIVLKGQNLDSSSINFPVLVKSDIASVTKMSHIMSVVFNPIGLEKALGMYDEAVIVQEFINHDRTVYKVYVIGDKISYNSRPSCSNISSNNSDFVAFDSAQPWPSEIAVGERLIKDLDNNLIRELSTIIGNSLGLSIFGFDLLVQSDTGELVIIDINVFPGFKEYKQLGGLFNDLILKKLQQTKLTP